MNELPDRIASLNNHYILCGIGRTGISIAEEFLHSGLPFVIIEQSQAAIERLQQRLETDFLYIIGDATEDEALYLAGIERASGLVTALQDDKDNVFVVLTARSLNPNLRIVARVNNEEENAEKLRQAGADQIVPPSVAGGREMASEMIRPEVIVFLNQMLRTSEKEKRLRIVHLTVDEIDIPTLDADKLTISDIGRHTGLLVLAIRRAGQYHYKPGGDIQLHRSTPADGSDILVVIGTQAQLDKARGEGR